VLKKIIVFNNPDEKTAYQANNSNNSPNIPDVRKYDNARIEEEFSAEAEFKKDAVFQVILTSSREHLGISNTIFRNVPVKYTIKELPDTSGRYNYIADQQMTLMATYPAYRDINSNGFKDVITKIAVLNDPAEKELYTLEKNFGVQIDLCFDAYGRLTSNAYIMLDQIVKLLNKYPGIKLEVDVFSETNGNPENDLAISQNQAQLLVSYLINRGIPTRRLVAKGYGRSKPISFSKSDQGRKLNRRVDFIVLTN
jgi:outer membrane protein OmpA-like peptidoglycan-associated protein